MMFSKPKTQLSSSFTVGFVTLLCLFGISFSTAEFVERTKTNSVDMLHLQTEYAYEMKIVHPDYPTNSYGFPEHPIEGKFSHKQVRFSEKDGLYNFMMDVKGADSTTESQKTTYAAVHHPQNNRFGVYIKNGTEMKKVFNGPKFLKQTLANAGKSATAPLADFLMTEAADGISVATSSAEESVDNSAACAAACHANAQCQFFVYKTDSQDEEGKNCKLLKNVTKLQKAFNKISGGNIQSTSNTYFLNIEAAEDELFYGVGGGVEDQGSLAFTSSKARVGKSLIQSPMYYSTAGYSMIAFPYRTGDPDNIGHFNAEWEVTPASWIPLTGIPRQVTWTLSVPPKVDALASLFIIPAKTLLEHIRGVEAIVGTPDDLYSTKYFHFPSYPLGLMVSHSGLTSPSNTLSLIQSFRQNNIPMDSLLMGQEWYSNISDENVPIGGDPLFQEFAYNLNLLPTPTSLFKTYRETYNVIVGGVRKSFITNSLILNVARSRGWIRDLERNIDFTIKAASEWYADNISHYYSQGMKFFKNAPNDERFFTQHLWTESQKKAREKTTDPYTQFSIATRYSLGMQRLRGMTVSTESSSNTWESLQQQLGFMQNWGLAGSVYPSFDIGGSQSLASTPDLLTRYFQLGALTPFMRIHSEGTQKPYNPVTFAEPYGSALRKAIKLHYRLIPMISSLLGWNSPIITPLEAYFSDYPPVRNTVNAFMIGRTILAAPVVKATNDVTFHLPGHSTRAEYWYKFDTVAAPVLGGQEVSLTNVPIDTIPLYVRAGNLVLLGEETSNSIIDLGQKPLELHIYGSKSGKATISHNFLIRGDILGDKCGILNNIFDFYESQGYLRHYHNHSDSSQPDCNFPKYAVIKWFLADGTIRTVNDWDGEYYQFPNFP